MRTLIPLLVLLAACRERAPDPVRTSQREARIAAPVVRATDNLEAPPPLPTTAPAPRQHVEPAAPERAQRERGIELLDDAIARAEAGRRSAEANGDTARARSLEIRARRLAATRAIRAGNLR